MAGAVNLALAGLACVVVAGAVVAVSAREARAALLGLLVVLLAAPLLADPLPGPLPIAARLAAAFLACRLIADRDPRPRRADERLATRLAGRGAGRASRRRSSGSGRTASGAAALGPAEAQAAGFAVGVLAASPMVSSRDVFRLGIGRDAPARRRAARPGRARRDAVGARAARHERAASSGRRRRGRASSIRRRPAAARRSASARRRDDGPRAVATPRPTARDAPADHPPVTVLPFLVIAFGAGAASLLTRGNARLSTAIGILGLRGRRDRRGDDPAPTTTLAIGGGELVGSEYLRLFALLGAVVALALAVLGLATTSHRHAPGRAARRDRRGRPGARPARRPDRRPRGDGRRPGSASS